MKRIFMQAHDNTAEYGIVDFIHFDPFNTDMTIGLGMSEEQLNAIGKVVEVSDTCNSTAAIFQELFGAQEYVGNTALTPKIHNVTHDLSYEYVTLPPQPKTEKELLAEQQAQILILQDTINTLLGL